MEDEDDIIMIDILEFNCAQIKRKRNQKESNKANKIRKKRNKKEKE